MFPAAAHCYSGLRMVITSNSYAENYSSAESQRMTTPLDEANFVSRRAFLRRMRWAPLVLLPARLHVRAFGRTHTSLEAGSLAIPFCDLHLKPRYPSASPLEDVLALVTPGSDEFLTEKHAFEIQRHLDFFSETLKEDPRTLGALGELLGDSLEVNAFTATEEFQIRSDNGIETLRRRFGTRPLIGRENILQA